MFRSQRPQSGRLRLTPQRVPAPVFAMLVIALLLSGCGVGDDAPAARVTAAEGLELHSDGGWHPLPAGSTIEEGSQLRTGAAQAQLATPDGDVWLAPHTSVVIDAGVVDVLAGDLLVAAGDRLEIALGDVAVSGEGTFRVTAGLSSRVGVYRGEVLLTRPGEGVVVPALRQVALEVRRLPAEPAPLSYRDDDEWDRRLLAPAISFDREIALLAAGIDRQYGVDPQAADFYQTFVAVHPSAVPVLRTAARTTAGERFGPPSDALVTLFVAQAIVAATDIGLDDAVTRVAQLRTSGARWGLIAMEFGADSAQLAAVVDLGQTRRLALGPAESEPVGAGDVAAAVDVGAPPAVTPPPSGGGGSSGGGGGGDAGSGSGGTGGDGGSGGGGGGGGGPALPDLPDVPVVGEVLDQVVDEANDVLEGVGDTVPDADVLP